ncbi:hypothetical protein M3Y99_00957700 [Aphelenchoides fujianensis]|nr:hypothetical protein M3Y99_00957700 [Aphelenchoides fujianensis]
MTRSTPLLRHFCLFALLLLLLPPIRSTAPPADRQALRPLPDRFFSVVRRGLLSGLEEAAERPSERSKNFGVGNNFVRHLRLLSRMSKKDRRAFLGEIPVFSDARR